MRKLLSTLTLLLVVMGAMAIPAKKGQWKTLTLADGTEVRAQLTGDEHAHFWMAEDGTKFVADGDVFTKADEAALESRMASRRAKLAARSRLKAPRKVEFGVQTHYTGTKKGLVILVQYTDVKFQTANNLEKYKRIMNEEGYSEGKFRGSVSDFFKAQSNGQFELDFDVVGPYTLAHNQKYYGGNDNYGNDLRPDEMIVEAVKAADAEVNFKDYDWDGDGEVDEVFVLYAGKGEADGGPGSSIANTVWPHMWILEDTDKDLTLDGVRINTYACSNEIDMYSSIEGIGCFCHEFSHCMGYPDLYDTVNNSNFGMGEWDLMCAGSYNGDTFCPAGYSGYEKWMAGWLEPIELDDKEVKVENLQPMSENGDVYIIYNKAHPDEYYTIENRQRTGWDAELPGRGLMITHVDFDRDIWEDNTPNANVPNSYLQYGYSKVNDHQRLTIFHADNTAGDYNQSTDLYPYNKKDSLTNTSVPKATYYNKNTDGSTKFNKGILGITQNTDRTMNFRFRPTATEHEGQDDDKPTTPTGDVLFYESFNNCNGKGGNDGNWETNAFQGKLETDNEGWDYVKGYGAYQCARFGTSSTVGVVTTPTIQLGDGEATLTFKAAEWNMDGSTLELQVSGNATITPKQVEMKSFEWQDFTCTIKGTGTTELTFQPVKRFILDEVKLVNVENGTTTAIKDVQHQTTPGDQRYYDLQGRYVAQPGQGLYIVNGKKVIVK